MWCCFRWFLMAFHFFDKSWLSFYMFQSLSQAKPFVIDMHAARVCVCAYTCIYTVTWWKFDTVHALFCNTSHLDDRQTCQLSDSVCQDTDKLKSFRTSKCWTFIHLLALKKPYSHVRMPFHAQMLLPYKWPSKCMIIYWRWMYHYYSLSSQHIIESLLLSILWLLSTKFCHNLLLDAISLDINFNHIFHLIWHCYKQQRVMYQTGASPNFHVIPISQPLLNLTMPNFVTTWCQIPLWEKINPQWKSIWKEMWFCITWKCDVDTDQPIAMYKHNYCY